MFSKTNFDLKPNKNQMGDLFCPSTEDFRTKVCWYSGNVFAPRYFSGSDVWKS